jgi:raffinose/stachyose/melibiose transport system substrate-binding protein
MQPKFTKIVTLLLLVTLLLSALAACAPATAEVTEEATEPPAAEPTQPPAEPAIKPGKLEVGVLWEEGSPSYDFVKAIGDSLIADYPGTEVIYTFNNTAARPAIEARMLAGDPLDIDFIFEGMDPNTYDWVTGGNILDISAAMNEPRADGTAWKDDFNPLFYPSMQYEDKFYGAPEQVFIWLLHYNKKMFDEWGVQPPASWDDLLALCETIKTKGVAPIAVTGQVNFYVGMWTDSLFQRIAGTDKVMEYLYGDTDMKIADDPDFLKALQEMMKLKDNGCLIEGWEGTDFTTNQVYFFQDKAAMILMGSWLVTEMKDSIPEGFQLAVAPFPTVADGKGNQDAIFGRALSWNVPAKTDVPDLAIEFLRRFTSNETAQKRADELGAVSPNVGVTPPPGIIGIDQVLEDAQTAEFILYNYGSVGAKFGLMDAWYNPVVDMWKGTLTPEEALAKIDENMTSVRAQRAANQ